MIQGRRELRELNMSTLASNLAHSEACEFRSDIWFHSWVDEALGVNFNFMTPCSVLSYCALLTKNE